MLLLPKVSLHCRNIITQGKPSKLQRPKGFYDRLDDQVSKVLFEAVSIVPTI